MRLESGSTRSFPVPASRPDHAETAFMRLTSLLPRLSAPAGAALALLCTLFALPASAHAEDWLARINSDLRLAPGNESVEQKLFPLLIEMDPFPLMSPGEGPFTGGNEFLFIERGDSRRQTLIDWVEQPAQQAVLDMVREIGEDFDTHMMSMQLGDDKVPAEWVEAGLYVETGRPGLELVGADFHYLEEMVDRLYPLSYANGLALAEAGDGDKALEDYARFLAIYRLLLDRPFSAEKEVAFGAIVVTCDLMTDLAYQYTRPRDNAFTPIGIADALLETDETLLGFARFLLPAGDAYTAQQAFDYASFGERTISADRFATMLASTSDKPGLSAFGSAAAFRDMAMMQADRIDFNAKLNDLLADYTRRWNYSDLHDDLLDNASVAQMTDGSRFYILQSQIIDKYSYFENVRLMLLTYMSGMRCSLGAVAFYLDNNNLPGRIVSIQPEYVRTIQSNLDYLNYNERIQQSEPLRYWVPMRDEQFGVRENPTRYPIKVVFDGNGMLDFALGASPATRARDLMDAIPFPGFSADRESDDDPMAGNDMATLLQMDALGGVQTQGLEALTQFMMSGTLPQFGLSPQDHAEFEAYLSGDSDSFNFEALRSVFKDMATEEGMTEQEAREFTQGLRNPASGMLFSPNSGNLIRQQLRTLVQGFSGSGGMDPSMLDGMGPAAMFLAGGDINETVTTMTGKSVDQLIDYIGSIVDEFNAVPALRQAVDKAKSGGTITPAEGVAISHGITDRLVTPQFMNPLRDMLVHFKNSEMAESFSQMAGMGGDTTQVVFSLDDSSFLLYSVGQDEEDDRAALIDGGGIQGDILFWPPTFSLYREYVNR